MFRIETSLTPAIGRPVDPPIKRAGNNKGNNDDASTPDDATAKDRYPIYKPNHEEMANVDRIRKLSQITVERLTFCHSEQERNSSEG